MYIHGGGFVVGSVKTRRAFTGYVADRMGYNVAAVEYRLAPEAPFPAASQDCFSVYRELIMLYDPLHVVILGESAGGNLVLSTLLRIKAAGLPQPAAAVCIAPCVQFDQTFPSYSENADRDSIVANLSEEVFDMYLRSRDPGKVRSAVRSVLRRFYRMCSGISVGFDGGDTARRQRKDVRKTQGDRPSRQPVSQGRYDAHLDDNPLFPEGEKRSEKDEDPS